MAQARRRRYNLQAMIGTVPMIIVAVGVYIVGIVFTVYWSFTNSKIFPGNTTSSASTSTGACGRATAG